MNHNDVHQRIPSNMDVIKNRDNFNQSVLDPINSNEHLNTLDDTAIYQGRKISLPVHSKRR